MKMNLYGKKVLLIAPKHYYLEVKIIESLELMGADVTYYPEVTYNRLVTLIRDKTFYPFNKILDKIYFHKMLNNIKNEPFDIFFLIRGGLIDEQFMESVQHVAPKAYYIMYQWDSSIHNKYESKLQYFSKVFTFDKYDARQFGIEYLPLFYTQEYEELRNIEKKVIYDISFIGTFHTDRLKVIKKVSKQCKEKGLRFHYHLYAGKINILLLLLKGKITFGDIKYFKNYGLTLEKIINNYSVSTAILDIEMTNQKGLTLRTLEALGSGRKLLTTNESIRDSEIYDEEFIQIIDRENPIIDIDFLNNKNDMGNKYNQYHIHQWLTKIMTIEYKEE